MSGEKKKSRKRKTTALDRREWRVGYLFLLPNFIGFLIFTGIPVIMGFYISLTDYTGFGKMNFIGFSNYVKMWSDSDFVIALKNNLYYTLSTVPLTMLFALLLALMLNRKMYGGKVFQTIYFFPNLTSMVAVGCVWLQIFNRKNGPVNQFLMNVLNMENPPKWFWGGTTELLTIVIVVVWKQAGYYMIMFMGGLKNIPAHLYEAAKIDGCGPWGIYVKIILPLCKTSLATLVVLTFNSVWNDYMGPMIYLDTDSKKTIQLGLATFRRQFDTDYGAIMAGTTLSLIPVVILYAVAQKYIVEGIAYAGVKG